MKPLSNFGPTSAVKLTGTRANKGKGMCPWLQQTFVDMVEGGNLRDEHKSVYVGDEATMELVFRQNIYTKTRKME